jgi:hypothetical protein
MLLNVVLEHHFDVISQRAACAGQLLYQGTFEARPDPQLKRRRAHFLDDVRGMSIKVSEC